MFFLSSNWHNTHNFQWLGIYNLHFHLSGELQWIFFFFLNYTYFQVIEQMYDLPIHTAWDIWEKIWILEGNCMVASPKDLDWRTQDFAGHYGKDILLLKETSIPLPLTMKYKCVLWGTCSLSWHLDLVAVLENQQHCPQRKPTGAAKSIWEQNHGHLQQRCWTQCWQPQVWTSVKSLTFPEQLNFPLNRCQDKCVRLSKGTKKKRPLPFPLYLLFVPAVQLHLEVQPLPAHAQDEGLKLYVCAFILSTRLFWHTVELRCLHSSWPWMSW